MANWLVDHDCLLLVSANRLRKLKIMLQAMINRARIISNALSRRKMLNSDKVFFVFIRQKHLANTLNLL